MLFLVILINSAVISTVVLVHYEALNFLNKRIASFNHTPRGKILIGVFGALIAHTVEIWIFALSYYFMLKLGDFGVLNGNFNGSLLDCSYFSFTMYTSLGLGDIEPMGDIRYLVGLEALTGLVLITWTASFLFIEMQKLWFKDT